MPVNRPMGMSRWDRFHSFGDGASRCQGAGPINGTLVGSQGSDRKNISSTKMESRMGSPRERSTSTTRT
jgi:hypothetical protein